MKKMTKKKANILVWTIVILVSLVFIALRVFLKYYMNIDIPSLLLAILIVWFLGFSLNLFSRNEKIKEMEKVLEEDIKEKEQKEIKQGKKPSTFSLLLIAIVCLIYSIVKGVEIVRLIFVTNSVHIPFKETLPNCIEALTCMICSIFIALIANNARKRKIFIHSNAKLISSVGIVLLLSTYIQSYYWDTTIMLPNMTVRHYFYLFSLFIIFFGRVFAIAIKMKEEQDLTI